MVFGKSIKTISFGREYYIRMRDQFADNEIEIANFLTLLIVYKFHILMSSNAVVISHIKH